MCLSTVPKSASRRFPCSRNIQLALPRDRASRFFTVGLAGGPNNTGGQMLRDIDENGGVRVMDDIDYRQERLCGLRVLALGD